MSHILIIKEIQYTDKLEELFSKEDNIITTIKTLEDGWKIWAKNLNSENPVDIILIERSRINEVVVKFAARIRRQSNIPILAVSEVEPDVTCTSELDKLTIDFVTSPLSADMIRKRAMKWIKKMGKLQENKEKNIVEQVCRRLDSSRENVAEKVSDKSKFLESRGIKIDTEKNLAWDEGKLLELRANEYKLLKYFMENKNQILVKQQILDALKTKEDKELETNTVAVNIRRLRQKVEKNPSRPTKIKTIRGMGYLWFDDK